MKAIALHLDLALLQAFKRACLELHVEIKFGAKYMMERDMARHTDVSLE